MKKNWKAKSKNVANAWKQTKKHFKKGNILLLAVAFLLGASFNAVIASLANDVIAASITKFFNVKTVEDIVIKQIRIGKFLAALLSFLITSLVLLITLFIYFYIHNHLLRFKRRKQPVFEQKTMSEQTQILQVLQANNALLEEQVSLLKKVIIHKKVIELNKSSKNQLWKKTEQT